MSAVELNLLLDALRPYSQDLTLVRDEKPYLIALNGITYSIHTGLMHDSGERRTNADEARIQLSKTYRLIQEERDDYHQVVFVGFFCGTLNRHRDNIAIYDGAVFTAWESEYALSKNDEDVGSLYGRFSHEQEALSDGAALHSFFSPLLGRRSNAISMRSENLGFYLENRSALHVASEEELKAAVQGLEPYLEVPEPGIEVAPEVLIGGHQEKVVITRTAYPRDPSFSRDVLAAYGHACAICGRQLGLVQAAHIIPHNQEDCPNHVTNGIALCAEHHKLYDDALLLPGPDRSLHLNPLRVEHLQNIGQGAGLDEITALARKQFTLPHDRAHHPNDDYLRRGIEIRLGKGD